MSGKGDEFDEARRMADKMTAAFALATKDAVTRMHRAGVPTVGVDRATGRLRWTLPDGSTTFERPMMHKDDQQPASTVLVSDRLRVEIGDGFVKIVSETESAKVRYDELPALIAKLQDIAVDMAGYS